MNIMLWVIQVLLAVWNLLGGSYTISNFDKLKSHAVDGLPASVGLFFIRSVCRVSRITLGGCSGCPGRGSGVWKNALKTYLMSYWFSKRKKLEDK